MAEYATRTEVIQFKDARDIGDLVADDGNRVSEANLATDSNFLLAIQAASGEIEAACLIGNRYTTSDLENLTGNSAALLKRICADVTMKVLWDRREADQHGERRKYAIERAEKWLDQLRKGERVFNVTGVLDAGVAGQVKPSLTNRDNQRSWARQARRIFPVPRKPDEN